MVIRKSSNRKLLYHLLPVTFWLLAAGVCIIPLTIDQLPITNDPLPFTLYLPAFLTLLSLFLLTRIKLHDNVTEPAFIIAVLLGIASYWLPSVIFLIVPAWVYLFFRHLWELKVFLASLIGFCTVAIWWWVLSFLSFLPPFSFSLSANLLAWVPTGAVLIAWIASAIARHNLQVR